MERLKKLNSLLNDRQRRWGCGLLILSIISSMIDVLGVGSIMPFFAILANAETTIGNETIQRLMAFLGIVDRQQLLISLGLGVFVLVLFSLVLKATLHTLHERFVHFFSHGLSNKMLSTYMSQSYAWRLTRNSSELAKNVLADIELIAIMNISPILSMISATTSILLLIGLIFFVNFQLALLSLFCIGGAFLIIYVSLSRLLSGLSKQRVYANAMRFTISAEAFQSPKEQIIYKLEPFFTRRFFKHSQNFARIDATTKAIQLIPRFAIEALAFGGLLLILLYWLNKGESFDEALPFLALYAFVGYRLMPLLQQIFSGAAQLKVSEAAVDTIYRDVQALDERVTTIDSLHHLQKTIRFESKIELRDINFSYQSAPQSSLRSLNLTFHRGEKVGFVGLSGSGKTTAVDVLMGLLDFQQGQLLIDDRVLGTIDVAAWQSNIGFVPQDVTLIDDTVGANIAIGVEPENWDIARMERAAKAANLHEFILRELDNGYQTILGERGARLSGGQRQRVAIARALYRQPKLLVLDEATSSLDNLTEAKVMESVYALDNSVTVVMVTHRLTTVRDCDIIFVIDNGTVVAQGTYEDLQSNDRFNQLANATSVAGHPH